MTPTFDAVQVGDELPPLQLRESDLTNVSGFCADPIAIICSRCYKHCLITNDNTKLKEPK